MHAKLLELTTVKRLLLPDHIPCGPFLAIGCCLWGGGSGHHLPERSCAWATRGPIGLGER